MDLRTYQMVPRIISSRLATVNREYGACAPASIAYACRTKMTDIHTGETWDYSDYGDGAVAVGIEGWDRRPGESDDAALQRLSVACQEAELTKTGRPRANALEGRTLRDDLPAEATLEQQIKWTRQAARRIHEETGAAVAWAIHPQPVEGSDNNHRHYFLSRRKSLGHALSTEEVEVLRHGGKGSKWLKAYRDRQCRTYNAARRFENPAIGRWSGGTYQEVYGELNKVRLRAGLEALEIPTPSFHEGPQITAIRRDPKRRQPTEAQAELMGANDFLTAANEGVAERNADRMARDAQLLTLGKRMRALHQIDDQLADLSPERRNEVEMGNWRYWWDRRKLVGDRRELSLTLAKLPEETRTHVATVFKCPSVLGLLEQGLELVQRADQAAKAVEKMRERDRDGRDGPGGRGRMGTPRASSAPRKIPTTALELLDRMDEDARPASH